MGEPTFMMDESAQTARALENTIADFDNGCNLAGSCAPGVGINMNEGAVVGTREQFTLLDQFGNARAAQISQHIGGTPYVDRGSVDWPSSGGDEGTLPADVIRFGDNPANAAKEAAEPSIDGTIGVIGNSTLNDIAVGWVVNI